MQFLMAEWSVKWAHGHVLNHGSRTIKCCYTIQYNWALILPFLHLSSEVYLQLCAKNLLKVPTRYLSRTRLKPILRATGRAF